MKSKVEKLKKGKHKMTVTVEPKELIVYFKSAYEKVAPEAKIKGFRPGKAPRKLVEEAVGVNRIIASAIDDAIQNEYVKAITENKLIPISAPAVSVSIYPDYGLTEDEIEKVLEFDAEFEVMPEVTLKDYSKVKVKKEKVNEIKKEDIEKVILNLRRQKANFADVKRGAKNGDRIEIDFEGSIKGVKKDNMCSKNHPLILGDKTLIPGFEEEILGMKKGEEKEFEIVFPADYHVKEMAKEKAKFKVKLNELKEVVLPELDAKFAEGFGFKAYPELEKAIEENLKAEVEKEAQRKLENEVLEKVLPFLTVEIPDGLVEQEIDRMVGGMVNQLSASGLTLENYLQSIKKTVEDLRKDMRETAEKNIKIGFLLGKVIEEEKIDGKLDDAGKIAVEKIIAKVTK